VRAIALMGVVGPSQMAVRRPSFEFQLCKSGRLLSQLFRAYGCEELVAVHANCTVETSPLGPYEHLGRSHLAVHRGMLSGGGVAGVRPGPL
jgi:hypothetical protein